MRRKDQIKTRGEECDKGRGRMQTCHERGPVACSRVQCLGACALPCHDVHGDALCMSSLWLLLKARMQLGSLVRGIGGAVQVF